MACLHPQNWLNDMRFQTKIQDFWNYTSINSVSRMMEGLDEFEGNAVCVPQLHLFYGDINALSSLPPLSLRQTSAHTPETSGLTII
jgi:hypothetical protein